jgi:hypothetical protein
MKNLLYLMAVVAIALASCKNNSGGNCTQIRAELSKVEMEYFATRDSALNYHLPLCVEKIESYTEAYSYALQIYKDSIWASSNVLRIHNDSVWALIGARERIFLSFGTHEQQSILDASAVCATRALTADSLKTQLVSNNDCWQE